MGHRNPADAAEIGHWHQRLAHAAAKYTRESMDISPVGAGRALVVSSRRCAHGLREPVCKLPVVVHFEFAECRGGFQTRPYGMHP